MKKKLLFWWVDDEPDRLTRSARHRIENPSKALLGAGPTEIQDKKVKTQQDLAQLEADLKTAIGARRLPNLIIIDQILTSTSGILRGSTLAVSLRAACPQVPVVGVTAVAFNTIAELQKDQFIEFFCIDDVQSGDRIADLYAIAAGFQIINKSLAPAMASERRQKQLPNLLDCPAEDTELLLACVPAEFLGSWDSEMPHAFARWVWQTFASRPGFLYDDLETATMLGLSPSAFLKIAKQFRACQYQGIFASSARRRWWVSKVRRQIRRKFNADSADPLWRLGRRLLQKGTAKAFSRCHGRASDSDCVPDVVAFEDELRQDRVQARSEDTKPVDLDTPPIGFEPYRVYCAT